MRLEGDLPRARRTDPYGRGIPFDRAAGAGTQFPAALFPPEQRLRVEQQVHRTRPKARRIRAGSGASKSSAIRTVPFSVPNPLRRGPAVGDRHEAYHGAAGVRDDHVLASCSQVHEARQICLCCMDVHCRHELSLAKSQPELQPSIPAGTAALAALTHQHGDDLVTGASRSAIETRTCLRRRGSRHSQSTNWREPARDCSRAVRDRACNGRSALLHPDDATRSGAPLSHGFLAAEGCETRSSRDPGTIAGNLT